MAAPEQKGRRIYVPVSVVWTESLSCDIVEDTDAEVERVTLRCATEEQRDLVCSMAKLELRGIQAGSAVVVLVDPRPAAKEGDPESVRDLSVRKVESGRGGSPFANVVYRLEGTARCEATLVCVDETMCILNFSEPIEASWAARQSKVQILTRRAPQVLFARPEALVDSLVNPFRGGVDLRVSFGEEHDFVRKLATPGKHPTRDGEDDPRRLPHKRVLRDAVVLLENDSLPCMVVDLNELGAGLEFSAPEAAELVAAQSSIQLKLKGIDAELVARPVRPPSSGSRPKPLLFARGARVGVEFAGFGSEHYAKAKGPGAEDWRTPIRKELELMLADRRAALRHAVSIYAVAKVAGDEGLHACRIVDLSEFGAQLHFGTHSEAAFLHHAATPSPENREAALSLQIVADGKRPARSILCRATGLPRDARRREGRGTSFGVRFEPPISREELLPFYRKPSYDPPPPEVIEGYEGDQLVEHLMLVFHRSVPFRNIVRRVVRSGCNYVAVEWGYEAADERLSFESHAHRRYRSSHRAARLHFFELSSGDAAKRRFLGSTVIRPSRIQLAGLQLGHAGKTVLIYPEGRDNALTGAQQARDSAVDFFLMGVSHRIVHPARQENILAVEYRQQSRLTGSCAHAALETVAGFLRKRFGSRAIREEDVRVEASWSGQRGAIVDDLMDHEIAAGMGLTGFNPRIYSRTVPDAASGRESISHSSDFNVGSALADAKKLTAHELINVLHLAIDSSLPAVLVLGSRPNIMERHAVVAIGHTSERGGPGYASDVVDALIMPGGPRTTTAWARDVLVHDDAIGPYLELPIRIEQLRIPNGLRRLDDGDLHRLWRASLQSHLEKVILPLPPQVRLDPADALGAAHLMLVDQFQRLRDGGNVLLAELASASVSGQRVEAPTLRGLIAERPTDEIVLGALLTEGHQFRAAALSSLSDGSGAGEGAQIERNVLQSIALPSHVYVFSLCSRASIEKCGPFGCETFGYIVLDATAASHSEDLMLCLRLGELLVFTCPGSGQVHDSLVPFSLRKQTGMQRWYDPPAED